MTDPTGPLPSLTQFSDVVVHPTGSRSATVRNLSRCYPCRDNQHDLCDDIELNRGAFDARDFIITCGCECPEVADEPQGPAESSQVASEGVYYYMVTVQARYLGTGELVGKSMQSVLFQANLHDTALLAVHLRVVCELARESRP